MFYFRPSRRLLAAWLALAAGVLVRAESPTTNAPPRWSDDPQQALYPLEWLTRSPEWGRDGLISDAGPDPTPLKRLAAFRSLWPEINVWSSAVPLLTADLGRLAPEKGLMPGLRPEGDKHVAKSDTDLEWAALNSKIAVRDRDALLDPSRRSTWETDETLKMPVAGPLFLFGQLGASTPAVEEQQHKWLGRTGVGFKVKPWFLEEVQVRGGPVMRYDATSKKAGQSPERSELFLEAVTKLPLPVIGPLKVEYTSFAVPAGTASERGQINQDFKLAKPFRGDNEFHFGAKYRTEDSSSTTPWVDRMQLYMGVQLKR
jgi:hypothetical protein